MNARSTWILRFAAAAVALVCLSGARPAEVVDTFTASQAPGYARLLFILQPAGHVKAQIKDTILTIAFDRKITITPSSIAQALPGYLGNTRADADGKTYRFILIQPVRLHTSSSSNKFAVDLAPIGFAGTMPDLPPPPPPPPTAVDVSKLPPLKVRAGTYQNFTRLVFDWPRKVPYAVFPGAGKLVVRFEALAKPDFSALQLQAPPWVKAAGWRVENKGTVVEFETDADSGYHDFRDGARIILDVLAPKTDADAYQSTANAQTAIGSARPNGAARFSPAKAIAAAAAQLNAPVNATAKPATAPGKPVSDSKPQPTVSAQNQNVLPAAAPQAAAPQAAQPAPPATPSTPSADAQPSEAQYLQPEPPTMRISEGKLTRDGAVLNFPGAGWQGSAVFMRGMTVWIVLQNAAALDIAKLKSQLGTFPDAVDAVMDSDFTVLRITLRQPERVAAIAEGANLKVVIAPQVNTKTIAIGFSRNQDDPAHSSLSTMLPGATKTVKLVDPVAGDELIVVPGTIGRAIINERDYLEFAALPTASGIVLAPFVDDLSVAIDRTRVTITRPGGLSLTPPTMPAPTSPEALARGGEGPCFLDFVGWRRITGGSFLATERRLRTAIARLKSETANQARLALARFYVANGFAVEALGMVTAMQTVDPALQSDMQLQTIRAAADYQMGRYRDAHNDLAGAQFDSDRHASLWRGLTAAALENWDSARTYLDQATPILDRYPPAMRARARIANANAALALGHLEIADAQLARLPDDLEKPLMLAAELARARLFAAENRWREANRLFAAAEQGGDERIACEAIYYRVSAALAARKMSPARGINALERLRFRWRGDLLELRILRRLAALYFTRNRWRNGLRTLRIATENFPNYDMAGKAQDDMRAAFVALYLKGKADALPPVEALALFYDFIELTPIGPDGDEMIRRMTDRLVAVDLLGQAADLLGYQVTKRLDGVARAQVATKLAMIQLMDHKPQAAIETLRTTQIATLPDDINHQRLLLEAKALAEEKLWDQALDLIATDESPEAMRLRADIYWQSGRWAVAAQKAEESLGARWSDDAPLAADERQQVMRAAVAFSLANDEASLERLRDHFDAKMKASPDASAFAVVTQRIDLHGLAFRDAAARIAAIDTLQSFMNDLRKRNPL